MLFSHGEAKKMKKVKLQVTAALLGVILAAGCAWGAEGDYLIKGDQVYRAEGGAQKLITDMERKWDEMKRIVAEETGR